MYHRASGFDMLPPSLDGLGLSLKPPAWARRIFRGAVSNAVITVQTPLGPQQVRMDDPKLVARVVDVLRGTAEAIRPRLTLGPTEPTVAERITGAVPGGFATIAALGLAAVALFAFMGRRRA